MPLDPQKSQTARIFSEFQAALALIPVEQISVRSDLSALYTKVLAVSCGSEFEDVVSRVVERAISARIKSAPFAEAVVQRLITRKYFQLFDFDKANINKLLELFPAEAKPRYGDLVTAETWINQSIKDFMALNRERNRLVHQNFAAASSDYTAEEVFALFESACRAIGVIEHSIAFVDLH